MARPKRKRAPLWGRTTVTTLGPVLRSIYCRRIPFFFLLLSGTCSVTGKVENKVTLARFPLSLDKIYSLQLFLWAIKLKMLFCGWWFYSPQLFEIMRPNEKERKEPVLCDSNIEGMQSNKLLLFQSILSWNPIACYPTSHLKTSLTTTKQEQWNTYFPIIDLLPSHAPRTTDYRRMKDMYKQGAGLQGVIPKSVPEYPRKRSTSTSTVWLNWMC